MGAGETHHDLNFWHVAGLAAARHHGLALRRQQLGEDWVAGNGPALVGEDVLDAACFD